MKWFSKFCLFPLISGLVLAFYLCIKEPLLWTMAAWPYSKVPEHVLDVFGYLIILSLALSFYLWRKNRSLSISNKILKDENNVFKMTMIEDKNTLAKLTNHNDHLLSENKELKNIHKLQEEMISVLSQYNEKLLAANKSLSDNNDIYKEHSDNMNKIINDYKKQFSNNPIMERIRNSMIPINLGG